MPSLKIGLQATAVYIAVVILGMVYMYRFAEAPYGSLQMITRFWVVELVLTAICLYYVVRHFGWIGVGFGKANWSALGWLLPSYIVLGVMMVSVARSLLDGVPPHIDWAVLALLTFTTFLIGFSEEVMFRGILLRAALTRLPVVQAMLISAAAFSLLHAVNGFGGQPTTSTAQQLAFTFLVGFFLAPVALKLGNLWPLIIWHWLWDLAVFSSDMMGMLHPYALVGISMQAVIGLWLWAKFLRAG